VDSLGQIEQAVNSQLKNIEEKTSELEMRHSEMDTKISGMMEKASKPMPDKIREIKALLKQMRDE
jgi:hypothetical protein